ncbi:hypothetical protein GCM10023231_41030 [Olivibacter ginsenosidimutans]|uniref:Uncharacterized protein n=1 Tax=Olivibacter ginsenosidimutans TaxID=1176537 RepID=A0ABP9CC21_9SPHI
MMVLKRHFLIYIFTLLSFLSCEISDITPENYWPKPGDRLDRVESFWGAPDDRDSYYDGDLFVITYYYYDEGVYIDFIDNIVDLVGTLE